MKNVKNYSRKELKDVINAYLLNCIPSNTEISQGWGATVTIDKVKYKLQARAQNAIYPYKHVSFHCNLEPVNKKTDDYLITKAQLGDDWLIGLRDDPEMQIVVAHKLGWTFTID